jgi:pre-mRNA-splicing factor ATP-dependent RNA helicase DHX38/PRP16
MEDEPMPEVKVKKEEPPVSAYRAPAAAAASSSSAAPAAAASSFLPKIKPKIEEDETEVDRAFYDDAEETGGLREDEVGEGAFLGDVKKFKLKEEEHAKQQVKKLSQRAQARNEDNNKWEENRMMTSGAVRNSGPIDLDFEEEEKRVQVIVHDMKPPFLDGRVVFTTQTSMVSVVKDSTSDLAILAKQGSAVLQEVRQKNEKNKMKNKFWELAGSNMGKLMGVKEEKKEAGAGGEGEGGEGAAPMDDGSESTNYKASSAFAKHLKTKTDAASAFSQEKTITMQREYLPIYTCREQLMRIVADSSIVVIVGETGSGSVGGTTCCALFNLLIVC